MKFSSAIFSFFLVTGSLGSACATGVRGGNAGDDVDSSPVHESEEVPEASNLLSAIPPVLHTADQLRDVRSDKDHRETLMTNQDMSLIPHKEERRVIIKYKAGSKEQVMARMAVADSRQRAAGNPAMRTAFDFDEMDTLVVTANMDTLADLNNDPGVEYMEEDFRMHLMGNGVDSQHSSNLGATKHRNLAEWRTWGVTEVNAPQVWEAGFKGQGVKVCVIDSGIDYDHSDFVTENLSGESTGSLEWYYDRCNHGTHVAGTIAAKDDDGGVVGVAPEAEIFVVRVFGDNCGWAYNSDIMGAARTCRNNGADVINMSLGGGGYSQIADSFFNGLLENDGVLSIAAAGNDGNTVKSYPASYSSVMSVAAVDKNKRLARFSQRNNQVDIAAPGVDVWSTISGDDFDNLDGTSMASPHVAGVAALLMSADPSASAADIRSAIENGAEDLGRSGRDNSFGYGFIDASAALQQMGSGNGGGGIVGDSDSVSCSDSPSRWYDSDGIRFNCAWYATGSKCQDYGDSFSNLGKTANEACCACGGGLR